MLKGDFRRVPHYQPVAFRKSLRGVEDLHVFPYQAVSYLLPAVDSGTGHHDAVGCGCAFFLFLVWFVYIYIWFEWKSCRGDGEWMSVFLRGWRGMLILFL